MLYSIDIPPEYRDEAASLLDEFLHQKNQQDGICDLFIQLQERSRSQVIELLHQQTDQQLARLYSMIASSGGLRTQAGQSLVDDAYRYGLSPGQRSRLMAIIIAIGRTQEQKS